MSRTSRLVFLPALLLSLAPVSGVHAEEPAPDPTRYGIGFQFSFPAFGLAVGTDLSDRVAAEAIIGMLADLKSYAGRGVYRFTRQPYSSAYGFGMLGAWTYKGFKPADEGDPWSWDLRATTETVFGMGAGVGVEYDWRGMSRDLPPVAWNLEIGVSRVEFNEIDYNFSALMIGAGAQYRF